IPDWCNRTHDVVAGARIGRQTIEHAHSKIEAVEQHIEEYGQRQDQRPNRNQIEHLSHRASPFTRLIADATTGTAPLPASITGADSLLPSGPLRTRRSVRMRPQG